LHDRKEGNRPIPIFSQLHRPPLQYYPFLFFRACQFWMVYNASPENP